MNDTEAERYVVRLYQGKVEIVRIAEHETPKSVLGLAVSGALPDIHSAKLIAFDFAAHGGVPIGFVAE